MQISTAKRRVETVVFLVAVIVVFCWASKGTEVGIGKFISGLPSMKEVLVSMLPPNFAILPKIIPSIVETVQIAIVSIISASIIALPICFLAAKNTSPAESVYRVTRLLLAFLRSVPTLLWALILIAMVGLGPFPGILGLTLHCIGSLGKYFSEAVENVNPEIIEAVQATGADRVQVIIFGIVPELKPLLLGYILYYFEYCIRTASMMGVVGAGGIGMELLTQIRLFRYQETLAILIIIVAMVVAVDTCSFLLRKRMIGLEMK